MTVIMAFTQAAALQGIIESALHVCEASSGPSSTAAKRGYNHGPSAAAAPCYKRVRRAAQHTGDCQSSLSDAACEADATWQAGSPSSPAHDRHALPTAESMAASSTSNPWPCYSSNDLQAAQTHVLTQPQPQKLHVEKPLAVVWNRRDDANRRHAAAPTPASPYTPGGLGVYSWEGSHISMPLEYVGVATAMSCHPHNALTQCGWPAWQAAAASSPAQVLGFPKEPPRLPSDYNGADGAACGYWSVQGGAADPVSPPSLVTTPPAACFPDFSPSDAGYGAMGAAAADHVGMYAASTWTPGNMWCCDEEGTPRHL
jgi:hypothetical protein